MPTVTVSLARPGHQYDILVQPGAGASWRESVEERVPADRYLVLADAALADILSLPKDGEAEGKRRWLRVAAGEANKTFDQYRRLCEAALATGIDRDTVVVALGGGVTGDLAGFVAATLLRGLRLAQIPTTLLAQVDSSVGGKNGIDSPAGKNLIGTFHQPDLVLVDPAFLDTLPEREYLAGLAEVAKTAILDGREFFDLLAANAPRLLARDHAPLADVVARCCRIKADIVMEDEHDRGRRALLNLGHTFGHALEAVAGYDGGVVHGEAVAVGTALAAAFAREKGLCASADADAVTGLLSALRLPVSIRQLGGVAGRVTREGLRTALLADKKNAGGAVNLVLPRIIGDCRVEKGYAADEVAEFMIGTSY